MMSRWQRKAAPVKPQKIGSISGDLACFCGLGKFLGMVQEANLSQPIAQGARLPAEARNTGIEVVTVTPKAIESLRSLSESVVTVVVREPTHVEDTVLQTLPEGLQTLGPSTCPELAAAEEDAIPTAAKECTAQVVEEENVARNTVIVATSALELASWQWIEVAEEERMEFEAVVAAEAAAAAAQVVNGCLAHIAAVEGGLQKTEIERLAYEATQWALHAAIQDTTDDGAAPHPFLWITEPTKPFVFAKLSDADVEDVEDVWDEEETAAIREA